MSKQERAEEKRARRAGRNMPHGVNPPFSRYAEENYARLSLPARMEWHPGNDQPAMRHHYLGHGVLDPPYLAG